MTDLDPSLLLGPLLELHAEIRTAVVTAMERQQAEELAEVHRDDEGDTIYAIDAHTEEVLLSFAEQLARKHSFVLIAEGLAGGRMLFPQGTDEDDATWRIIVDPIDGTRGIMYQKRSAWILTGVAPNRGPSTSLADIVLAIQTEIPVLKQHLSDQIWAVRSGGVHAFRYNRLTGVSGPLGLRPSNAGTIEHGFAMISRFFPGSRATLAEIDDEIAFAALGPAKPGKASCFEDQYISTGGQLYELMAGRDRFIADLRPLVVKNGLCCHPYDLCTFSIARELGVIVTDAAGAPLDAPFNVEADIAWVGYANERIRRQIEPHLQSALRKRGLIR